MWKTDNMGRIGYLCIKILVICFLVTGQFQLYAQSDNSFRFVTYSNKDGFNQNTVKTIERDRAGSLWLGTSNGLIKYDGYSFKNVSWQAEHKNNVYHGPITGIHSDSKGLLWIVSNTGLNLYSPEMERFFKATSDSLDMLYKTVEDRDGSMWILGDKYLSNVQATRNRDTVVVHWKPNLLKGSYARLMIQDLLVLDDGSYLLATNSGLYRMSYNREPDNINIELKLLVNSINATVLNQHNHMIWIGTRNGLFKTVLDGSKIQLLNGYKHIEDDPGSIAHDFITDILVDSKNRLWVGTWRGGLSLLNEDRETFSNFSSDPKEHNGISGNMINCLFEDPFNVLWIGTAQAGLCKLDLNRKQFANLEYNPYDESTISGNLINNILEDSEGYLWIASYGEPLARSTTPVGEVPLSNLKFKRFDHWYNSFYDKVIQSIFEDRYGNIWLGYEESVVVYNKKNASFTRLVFESGNRILPIHNVRNILPVDHERLLVAGSQLLILKDPWSLLGSGPEVRIPVLCNYQLDNRWEIVTTIVENPENIWVGFGGSGLARFRAINDSILLTEHFEYLEKNRSSISNNNVFCIHRDPGHNLWIGTFGGGLNLLVNPNGHAEKGFLRLQDTISLADNAIYGIIEENDSILWCGTDMGICKLNTRTFETTIFNMHDGLPNNNFRMNAYHKGKSGYYYFGGLNGLTAFKPEQIRPNTIAPKVRLSSLKINNRIVPVGRTVDNRIILDKPLSEMKELVLLRSDRTVSIQGIVDHTAIPEKNRLAYYLEGFDKEWIEVSQGSFSPTYTNLPPGDYTFRVRAYNCDGIMSEEESVLQISMLAPWFARPLYVLLFILFGLMATFGLSRYFIKMKSLENKLHFEQLDKERIKEVNQAKLRFFTNISHEFKTPLSLIFIPLQKLQALVINREEKEYVDMIQKNSNRLMRLIDQLLTFRRIEHGKLVLDISNTSLEGFIYPVADAFESYSVKKGIQFYYQMKDPAFRIHLDIEKMEQVLFNLLSNAFKHTPANGEVRLEGAIRTIDGLKYACFDVTDNGSGIQVRDKEKIFERFYQSGKGLDDMGGTGIGLSYSKSMVELHKGSITVESIPGERTCFSVMLPLDELHSMESEKKEVTRLNADELLEIETLTGNLVPDESSSNTLKPTVLVVDDEIEFRNIIRGVLQKDYKVIEAANGKEGLNIATKGEVDIIISDVLMPGLNGYEFCRKIKMDMQLCHIPVILLTALEEMDSQIRGVEHGVDSYISKPFNLKYLEVTVQKLIENRNKLKLHFTQFSSLPTDVKISDLDAKFIEMVNSAIQYNLDDSSFGVEELATSVNLSTSQLYRKLKLLTGQIPNAYLRNYRLQTAADILTGNPGISVKSVMYEVGIESASHFSHAFKKKFGYSPSEFA